MIGTCHRTVEHIHEGGVVGWWGGVKWRTEQKLKATR